MKLYTTIEHEGKTFKCGLDDIDITAPAGDILRDMNKVRNLVLRCMAVHMGIFVGALDTPGWRRARERQLKMEAK